jgi:hypothetical protein
MIQYVRVCISEPSVRNVHAQMLQTTRTDYLREVCEGSWVFALARPKYLFQHWKHLYSGDTVDTHAVPTSRKLCDQTSLLGIVPETSLPGFNVL